MLDADTCYRALTARDARFDGRFFTAVLTTGIYCRPVCPARTPRRENVRFYASAAAAADAGYRPCRRCRPESSPGTPAWNGTSATVSRALALIAQGACDAGDVERLAARVGVGARHLRRLFLEHLGATPIAIAQTRRAHFAKRLIDETELPMLDVALASGFQSVRRFNAAVREAYGSAPRELRRRRAGRLPGGAKGGELELRVPYRPPLDWAWLAGFLGARAIPGVECVEGGEFRRALAIGQFRGVIRVRAPRDDEPVLVLRVPAAASRSLLPIVDAVRRVFDLDADPLPIGALLLRDARLAAVLGRRPGLRVPGSFGGFELAVRGILGQQISVAGARTIAGRLVARFGEALPEAAAGDPTHLFPTPEALAEADLSGIGVPAARQRALRALACAVRDGALDLDGGAPVEETLEKLCALPGIGPWTAQYVAMRALREPDAFPAGDLGVRRALSRGGRLPSVRDVETLSQAWRPWRAYATLALWTGK